MTASEIRKALEERAERDNEIFIPEFTWFPTGARIDAIAINCRKRMIRGYEIKTSRADFQRDRKWQGYSAFCSTVTIVCPPGLIAKEEVSSPFGLAWVSASGLLDWQQMGRNIQSCETYAWTLAYLKVLECELRAIRKGRALDGGESGRCQGGSARLE